MTATSLDFAFCLYKYFPHGGMQRAFRRIAEECLVAGARVRVYASEWHGPVPDGLDVRLFVATGTFNHTRRERFVAWLEQQLAIAPADCVVGFNKMPGLDVYYAADGCYLDKALNARSALYRKTPRYRHFSAYERAVFEPEARTVILMSSPRQLEIYQRYYGTPERRFVRLPPGIAEDRKADADAPRRRARIRSELALKDDQHLVLLIGSGFVTKGLDRAIVAVAALPSEIRKKTELVAIGADNPDRFIGNAERLGIAGQFRVFTGRDDIPDWLQAADLLIHPAYFENTGNVLLEAIVAGLPLVATDVCGFAHYITDADAGRVLASPFSQDALNRTLADMLCSPERARWRENGIAFGQQADVFSLPARAAEVVLAVAQQEQARRL